jgi:hypothetical protein
MNSQANVKLTPRQESWRATYGPWAVVTGASDGIGREMALCLAKMGLKLVLVARRRTTLEQFAADISNRYGTGSRVIAADLAQPSGVEAVIAATADLDIGLLVACAGFGLSGRLIDSAVDQEASMVDVNCRAVLSLSHHFSRRFAAQRRGGLVLMSSLLAFQGVPLSANYAATKAYIQSLAEALYYELAPLGVDVLASAPGPIHTGFAARADMRMGLAQKPENVAQETLNALGRRYVVRPGWLSKALEGTLAFLPRWGRVRAMMQVMKGMTKHQAAGQRDQQPSGQPG